MSEPIMHVLRVGSSVAAGALTTAPANLGSLDTAIPRGRRRRRPAGPAPAMVQRMSLEAALALGPEAWDRIVLAMPRPNPFASWAWHYAWHDAAPEAERRASDVLVLRDATGAPVALLPLGRRTFRLHRLPVPAITWAVGDLGCPDNIDVIAMPGVDLRPFVDALDAMPWSLLALGNLLADAPGARQLADGLRARGHAVVRRPLHTCHYVSLPSDWDDYLATLSPRARSNVRSGEKRLVTRHQATITRYDEPERTAEGLRHVQELHERRWEGQGSFSRDPRFTRMQQTFVRLMAAQRRLSITTLDVNGVPVAADLCLTMGERRFGYICGRDPAWDHAGVGRVLMGISLRLGIEDGQREMDFLRGTEPYKGTWGTSVRTTEELLVMRRTVAGQVVRLVERAGAWRARHRR